MVESKADELRRLAQQSVDMTAQAHALAESSQGLTGAARRDAAEEWWVIVRGLQKVNTSLRDVSAADILAAIDDATAHGRAAGDAEGYARGHDYAMERAAVYAECEGKLATRDRAYAEAQSLSQVAAWCRARKQVPRG